MNNHTGNQNWSKSLARILGVASVFAAIGLVGVMVARAAEAGASAAAARASAPVPSPARLLAASSARVSAKPARDRSKPLFKIAAPSHPLPTMPRIVMMEVTAYCPCPRCCGPNAQGITASGKYVDYNDGHFVAADTDLLPFGTKLVIPGYHTQAVEVIDRGGAIKGNRLDVFYPSHEEALKWGRRVIPVMIVD